MNKQSWNLFKLKTRTNFAGHQERCCYQPLDGEHLTPSCAELRNLPQTVPCPISHGQKCQTKVKSWSIEKMVGSLWNFKHPVQTRNHTAISQPGRKEVVKGEAFPQHKMEKQPGSKPKGDQTLPKDRTERKSEDSKQSPQTFRGAELFPVVLKRT